MNTSEFLNIIDQLRIAFKRLYEAFSNILGGTHGTPSADAGLDALLAKEERINNHRKFLRSKFDSTHTNEKCQSQVHRRWNCISRSMNFIR